MIEKNKLRKELITQRQSLSKEDVEAKSIRIINDLLTLDEIESSDHIMIYMSFRNEVDTKYLFEELLSKGKKVIAGRCYKDTKEIVPVYVTGYDDFDIGNYGILEPKILDDNMVDVEDIDVVIVPGVGFDRKMDRIGFGAGYYDRFLSRLREDALRIAICYDEQIIEHVPTDDFDLKMDIIITDKEIIK